MGLIRSLNDYGGALQNYAPVTDPTTDEDAKFRNRYACDVAMLTRTAPRAIRRFVGVSAGTPTDPVTGLVHDAAWGNAAAVKPVVAYVSTGVWTVTWPATVSDELTALDALLGGGVTHSVNWRASDATVEQYSGALCHARSKITASNVITVYGFNTSGVANDLVGATITVFGY